jgi:MFS family permease
MTTCLSIDDAPWNRLLIWTFIYTAGGMLLDGYIFGSTSVAMAMAGDSLGLSPAWLGAVTASVLAGVFLGSLLAGRLADRFGRQKVFFWDLVLFLVGSVLQLWATDPVTLFIIRFVIGVAIGAEYAVGSSLMAEFAPRTKRSFLLSSMTAMWSAGYVVGYFVAYGLREGGTSWQWILASAAVLAALVLASRVRAPESPRWLVSKGRVPEARAIVKRHYGEAYDVADLAAEKEMNVSYATLFGPKYRTRTAFAALFWTCQVTVSFAMLLFLPTVLDTLNLESEFAANVFINFTILVGVAVGIWSSVTQDDLSSSGPLSSWPLLWRQWPPLTCCRLGLYWFRLGYTCWSPPGRAIFSSYIRLNSSQPTFEAPPSASQRLAAVSGRRLVPSCFRCSWRRQAPRGHSSFWRASRHLAHLSRSCGRLRRVTFLLLRRVTSRNQLLVNCRLNGSLSNGPYPTALRQLNPRHWPGVLFHGTCRCAARAA